uniref:Uncharacterized protein n=1 Tax=Anguilla anguilla TaxID=7936 RepID=A0A0E9XCW7_ANGAN
MFLPCIEAEDADLAVGNLLFLGPEEAGLLLGNTVLSLGQRKFGAVPPLLLDFFLGLLFVDWVLTDSGVSLFVHLLHGVGGDAVLDEAGELLLVGVLVLLHQVAHVLGHVDAHDVLAVDVRVELLAFGVVAREALGAVRDGQPPVDRAFESPKHFVSGCGSGESCVQVAGESTGLVVDALHIELISSHLHLALVNFVKAKLVQKPAGHQQSSAVGRRVVRQPHGDSVLRQLVGVGGAHDHVSLYLGVSDLADNVPVGEPDDHPVLGCVVLVLVLDDQALAGKVVGLSLSPPPELHLVSLEVGLILDHLNETHFAVFRAPLPGDWSQRLGF